MLLDLEDDVESAAIVCHASPLWKFHAISHITTDATGSYHAPHGATCVSLDADRRSILGTFSWDIEAQ